MKVFVEDGIVPQINDREIFRYANTPATDEAARLKDECFAEIENELNYKICYLPMLVRQADEIAMRSKTFARAREGADKIVLFAATVGAGIDRAILKYSRTNQAKMLMMQAIGAERVESLCNEFCAKIGAKTRFSPGFGDMGLEVQKNIFAFLECEKHLGIRLNESLLMSPSKSVTAFAIVREKK